jgi:hypothetical protein
VFIQKLADPRKVELLEQRMMRGLNHKEKEYVTDTVDNAIGTDNPDQMKSTDDSDEIFANSKEVSGFSNYINLCSLFQIQVTPNKRKSEKTIHKPKMLK